VTPQRQIRAVHTADTITVYQAYPPAIAAPAIASGRFTGPFKRDRMTWIKPSFLWMAYRSGWASKPGQEHVLAIEITRDGFHWALEHASLSHHDPAVYANHDEWAERKQVSPVRIQWDPERDLHHQPLDHRSLQIGLSGDAVRRYVDEWTINITDITDHVHRIGALIATGQLDDARQHLPDEQPYPLTPELAATIGATTG
jgi:hypothetical protein